MPSAGTSSERNSLPIDTRRVEALVDRFATDLPVDGTLFLLTAPDSAAVVLGFADRLPSRSAVIVADIDPDRPAEVLEGIRAFAAANVLAVADCAREAVAQAARFAAAHSARRIHRLSLGPRARRYAQEYRELEATLRRSIHDEALNRVTQIGLARRWYSNILKNLAMLPRSMEPLVRRPPVSEAAVVARRESHEPSAIVVGAGPGLDEAIGALRRMASRVPVIAADTALPALTARGIPVSLVVAVDSQVYNAYDFVGGESRNVPLAYDLSTHPSIVRRPWGYRRVALLCRSTGDQIIDRIYAAFPQIFPTSPLGSVGATAVEVALRMFAGAVYVVGIDFAYRLGKPHAEGTISARVAATGRNRLNPLPRWSAGVARPSRRAVHGDYVSDAVLRSHAEVFNTAFADTGRVFRIGPGVGLNRCPAALHVAPSHAPDWGGSPAAAPAHDVILSDRKLTTATAVGDFLAGEETLIDRAIAVTTTTLNDGAPPQAEEAIEAVRYVAASFPDPAVQIENRSYLRRFVIALRFFKQTLRATQSILRENEEKTQDRLDR